MQGIDIADKTQNISSNEILQLVSFNIGIDEFGIDILKVQEIIRTVDITRVPNAPVFIKGVINLRGKVIPVIDLRIKIGLEVISIVKDSRIIVIEHENKIVGFLVDNVNEVLRINKNLTEAPPPMVGSLNSDFITAIGKLEGRLLILLDLGILLRKNNDDSLLHNNGEM